MNTKKVLLLTALILLFVSCATQVIIEFNAEVKIKLVDKNQNVLNNVEVTMERVFDGQKTGIVNQELTDASGEFQFSIKEGNAASRYHRENPVELNYDERLIDCDHEYFCVFKKEGFVTKDTTIVIKNTQNLNVVIKLEQIQ